jgi:WD40 repeat protein
MCVASSLAAKPVGCLDHFRNFKTVQIDLKPTVRLEEEASQIITAWYGECILVGTKYGLSLYDIHQPDESIALAHINERAIENIAVNPRDMTIAFNVARDSTVYFIKQDKAISTWKAEEDAIRAISFSSDGAFTAVASAKIIDTETEYGLYYDSVIHILDTSRNVLINIPSDHDSSAPETIVTKAIFSDDNKHLFTYNLRQGYDSDTVTYWDIQTGKKVWNYDDLFENLKWIPGTDPLWITDASMSNHIVALGGKAGVNDWDDYNGTAVHLWDVDTQQRLGYVAISYSNSGKDDEHLTELTFNHDGSILVTGQNSGFVRFWNTKNTTEITGSIQFRFAISQLAYDSSDKYLAIQDGKELVIWGIEMNIPISTFDVIQAG